MLKLSFGRKIIANNSFKINKWELKFCIHKSCGFCWHELDRYTELICKRLELLTSHSNWKGPWLIFMLTLNLPLTIKIANYLKFIYDQVRWQWAQLIQRLDLTRLYVSWLTTKVSERASKYLLSYTTWAKTNFLQAEVQQDSACLRALRPNQWHIPQHSLQVSDMIFIICDHCPLSWSCLH